MRRPSSGRRQQARTRAALAAVSMATLLATGCGGSTQVDEYLQLPPSSFAGLKAGIACSAVFVAKRPLQEVIADELAGMPTAAGATAAPVVDPATQSVSVGYSAEAPPRVAVHRSGRGCTILPPGATPERAADLPNPEITRSRQRSPTGSWPDGTATAANPGLARVVEIPAIFAHAAYSGIGHRGQYITVIPSQNMVVVRTGLDPEEGGVLWRQDRFFADLIDALEP